MASELARGNIVAPAEDQKITEPESSSLSSSCVALGHRAEQRKPDILFIVSSSSLFTSSSVLNSHLSFSRNVWKETLAMSDFFFPYDCWEIVQISRVMADL